MSFFDSKSGQGVINAWVVGLIGLFVVGLVWLVFSRPFNIVYSTMSALTTDQQALSTLSIVKTAFYAVPILLIIGLAIWILVAGTRKEPYMEQY